MKNLSLNILGYLLIVSFLIAAGCKKDEETSVPALWVPTVITDSVEHIQVPYALCSGSIQDTGSGKILRFGFCWSTTPNPAVDNPNSSVIDAGQLEFNHFWASITPLSYNITYYVRAFASNKDGYGYGLEMKFTTDSIPPVVADGYYVTGSATAYSDFNARAKMKPAMNEVNQHPRESLLELYIPIKAGPDGFSIVKMAGNIQKTVGPEAGFGIVTTPAQDEPTIPFQRGPVSETSTVKFTVPEDGFYHVVFDYVLNKVAIARVHWEMIGAATTGGWAADTELKESDFNLTSMSWTQTDITLRKGEWKFRYSHGWKIKLDTVIDTGGGSIGVAVNTNLGGYINQLAAGENNIINSVAGIYRCRLAYIPDTGYMATLTRTGNIPGIDYSSYQMGIIGDSYLKQDGTPAFWDENFGTSLPSVNGTNYTWTYTIDFMGGKDFKFRQGDDWSGKSISYGDVTLAGNAAANFTNNVGNFKISTSGNYTLVLNIEAITEIYTLTVTKN